MLGGARSATRTGRLRAPHPVLWVRGGSSRTRPPLTPDPLNPSAFRIFQRQLELTRQRLDGSPLTLPSALCLEAEVADAAAPRRDHAADRAIVTAIGMILVESTYHVR